MSRREYYARRPHHTHCALLDGFNACTCGFWWDDPTPQQAAYDRAAIERAHVAALEWADLQLTHLLNLQPLRGCVA